jgi:hypothetical protein
LADLDKRLELLKQAMAEPITAPEPPARDADEFYQWLLRKQGEYRRKNAQCANAPAQKEEP